MSYEYPFHAISRDYLRAAFGFMLFALPAALMDLPRISAVIFSVLAVLSLLYGFQTFRRQKTHVQICEQGIEVAPGGISLAWHELTKLAVLSFFEASLNGRADMQIFLDTTLAGENEEVTVELLR